MLCFRGKGPSAGVETAAATAGLSIERGSFPIAVVICRCGSQLKLAIGATAEASYRLYRQVGGMLGKTAIAAPHMHTCEIYLPDKFCNMYATSPEALFNVLVRIFK